MGDLGNLPNGVGMLGPFDTLYEQPKPRFIFKMPRVVPDQKHKFEKDALFRRLSRESEAFVATGTNVQLVFGSGSNRYLLHHHQSHNTSSNSGGSSVGETDFEKEPGKVHLRSHFIMDGVCVYWRGWIDLERLDGVGCLEFDEERAAIEDSVMRKQIEMYNQGLREFEERQRPYRAGLSERGSNNGGPGSQSANGTNDHSQSLELFNNG
ncbi:hypothetical protein V9T40_007395 [Parthenolecanium corni]|uniref:Protein big brother n=1 Tax=Parthenolecanium corni TaxID=536013 RepID=A0AAN9YBR3_9HEMI